MVQSDVILRRWAVVIIARASLIKGLQGSIVNSLSAPDLAEMEAPKKAEAGQDPAVTAVSWAPPPGTPAQDSETRAPAKSPRQEPSAACEPPSGDHVTPGSTAEATPPSSAGQLLAIPGDAPSSKIATLLETLKACHVSPGACVVPGHGSEQTWLA